MNEAKAFNAMNTARDKWMQACKLADSANAKQKAAHDAFMQAMQAYTNAMFPDRSSKPKPMPMGDEFPQPPTLAGCGCYGKPNPCQHCGHGAGCTICCPNCEGAEPGTVQAFLGT